MHFPTIPAPPPSEPPNYDDFPAQLAQLKSELADLTYTAMISGIVDLQILCHRKLRTAAGLSELTNIDNESDDDYDPSHEIAIGFEWISTITAEEMVRSSEDVLREEDYTVLCDDRFVGEGSANCGGRWAELARHLSKPEMPEWRGAVERIFVFVVGESIEESAAKSGNIPCPWRPEEEEGDITDGD